MKKRISILGLLVVLMSLSFSMLSFAGEWKNDTTGWWYVNNNSYPVNEWAWIDGNNDGVAECYFFNANGYMVANTTVDNCIINENGAWVLNGVVQTKQISIEDKEKADTEKVYKDTENDKAVNDSKNSNDGTNSDNKGFVNTDDIDWNGANKDGWGDNTDWDINWN